MRLVFFLAATACLLSACGKPTLQTVIVRKEATIDAPSVAHTSIVIPVQHAEVSASLRAGAQQCLNRTWNETVVVPGATGSQTQEVSRGMTSSVTTRGGLTELSVQHLGGAISAGSAPQQGRYVVDATTAPAGTRLDFYGGIPGSGALTQAVESWARTGQIRCPVT